MGRAEAEPLSDELSFAGAEELFAALGTPDAVARRNVLGWVATHPAETIALGPFEGRDIVDYLIGLINRKLDYPYWEDITITIGAFDDPRVTDFFVELLDSATEGRQAYDAASALKHRLGAEGLRERLIEIVLSEGVAERTAATAELLAEESGLPPAAAVRVAALEQDAEAPPVDDASRQAWLAEIDGPFSPAARERLEGHGLEAMHDLAMQWDSLSADARIWLLEWVSEAAPEEPVASAAVTRALEQEDAEVALAGLTAIPLLPEGAAGQDALGRWAAHADPELRGAAIASGAAVDLDAVLAAGGPSAQELAAALPRVAARGGAGDAALVTPHLRSESLEVRAAARDAVVAIGPDAIEPVRELVADPSPEVRAGAVRALLDLGDDEWLAAELLDESAPG